jgi:hypothetical protein
MTTTETATKLYTVDCESDAPNSETSDWANGPIERADLQLMVEQADGKNFTWTGALTAYADFDAGDEGIQSVYFDLIPAEAAAMR